MKRLIVLFMIIALTLSLTACGSSSAATTASAPQATETPAAQAEAATQSNVAEENTETPSVQETNSEKNRVLIVYFSPANADSVDIVSGATPRVGEISSVEFVANLINAQISADTAKIVPSQAYPAEYNATADKAKNEQNQNERPAFTLSVNPEEYDVIFIGYPIWWYHLPMIMQSFFDTYDLSGKTIIPFNTHAGSRDGGTYREVAAFEPNATVLEGLAVSGDRAGNAESDVQSWLSRLTY